MTALEVLEAATAVGIALSVTERGTLRYRPTPSPDLLAEMRANRDGVLAILRDPNSEGRKAPSHEAMEAAHRTRREALYVPPAIDLNRPGVGQQFRDEMQRLGKLGLVFLHPGDAVAAGGGDDEGNCRVLDVSPTN